MGFNSGFKGLTYFYTFPNEILEGLLH